MFMLFELDMHAGVVILFGDADGWVGIDETGEGRFGYEARWGAEEGLHLGVVLSAHRRFR